MSNRLPDDVCRCHDRQCEVRTYCERWRQREHGGLRTVHADTLRQGWEPFNEFCRASIPVGENT